MEKQLSISDIILAWCIVIAILGVMFIHSNEDYADSHEWFVEHSEIK